MQAGRYYRWTGATPLGGLALCLLAAALVAPVLGALYGALDHWNPIIYVNLVGGLGASGVSGWCVAQAALKGSVRNPLVALAGGLMAGVLVFYASWVGWLAAASKGQIVEFNPVSIAQIASELSVEGVWSLGHGDNVSGMALYGIWAIEALALLGMAPFFAYTTFNAECYCESCKTWVPDGALLAALAPVGDKGRALRSAFEAGDFRYAQQLGAVTESQAAEGFTEVQLRSCKDCSNLHLLTAASVAFSRDKKGELVTQRTPIFSNLVIDSPGLEKLRNSLPAPNAEEGAEV